MSRERSMPVRSLRESFNDHRDELRSDYAMGTTSRFRPAPRGVAAMGSGADYHYRNESQFLRMIERARFFDRDNMIVGQGVNRLVANVIQDGFTLDVRTGDKKADKEIYNRWWEWAEDPEQCDYEGEKSFCDMESLLFRQVIVDGDVIALPLADFGSLQLVEAHRMRTPSNTKKNVVHGVQLDDGGRRVAYWITKEDLDPLRALSKVSDTVQYATRDAQGDRQVFHVYNPRRISQRRGVTSFAPVVDPIGIHDDLEFAHLIKAQVASCFAIFEQVDMALGIKPGATRPAAMQTGAQVTETLEDGSARTIQGLAPGMRVRGSPGVKLEGFSPNIPNPEFFEHAKLILTIIAVNLDIPLAVLLLDPSNTNFSGWRGAIDQARLRFRQMQSWYRKAFHAQVYKWKLRQWISQDDKMGRLFRKLGPAIFEHIWHAPTWRYIEPNKDAMADDLRLTRGLISRRRRDAEQGLDNEEHDPEIVTDNGKLIRLALAEASAINAEFPDAGVTWQQVLQPYGATPVTVPDPSEQAAAEQATKQPAGGVA